MGSDATHQDYPDADTGCAPSRPRLLTGIVIIALGVSAVSGMVGWRRYRAVCQDGTATTALHQLFIAMHRYSEAHPEGHYPPTAPEPNVWTPDLRALYPEHLTDPDILVSPLHPQAARLRRALRAALASTPPDWETAHRITAQSILYTGVALEIEADLEHFIAAGMPKDVAAFDIPGQPLQRLRFGVGMFFVRNRGIRVDLQATDQRVVYMMEQPALMARRNPAGMLVLVEGGEIVLVGRGERFPALASVAHAFPPPPCPVTAP